MTTRATSHLINPTNSTSPLQLIDTVQVLSSAVLSILHAVVLLLFTLTQWMAGYIYLGAQFLFWCVPSLVKMVQVVLQNLLSLTSYADDVILSASDSLYYFIDSSLDVLECLAVELHAVLPYFAALPLQVLRILLDWSRAVGLLFSYLLPSTFYTSQTLVYINELTFAFSDLHSVSWMIFESLLEQSSNFVFNTLLSLITSAKYIAYFTIRVLQISCCQIIPTMVQTVYSSLMLVFTNLLSIPSQLAFNFFVLIEYYEIEIQNAKLIIQVSIQLILSLIYHVYHYLIQFFLFIFQPILSLIEFVVYLLHATFSLLIPGGLVTILIGMITVWKWYRPTQPHPSPTTTPSPPSTPRRQFTPPPTPVEPATAEEALQNELESERELRLCVVCAVNTKSCVLLPCRHCCLCVECSGKLRSGREPQCPLCRHIIDDVMDIYL